MPFRAFCSRCGYEPSAVNHTFASIGGMFGTVKAMLAPSYTDPTAAARLAEEARRPHGPLVQLGVSVKAPRADERVAVGAA